MASDRSAYVSLFSGAGGLDLGLECAGWRTVYASDLDQVAVDTLKVNVGTCLGAGRRAFTHAFVERADVRALDAAHILSRAAVAKGDVQMLAGGPPCQSWSSAGHQLGYDDPRGKLFDDFVRVANDLDVRWLLLENVRGILTARGADGRPGSALERIRRDLLRAGFQTTVALLNAADYGVPQRRVRLFMVGFRVGDVPPFPQPTHSAVPRLDDALPWVPMATALDAVGPLSADEVLRPSGKLAADLEGVLPGRGVRSPGKAEKTRPGGHWGYKQGAFVADPSRPARTVTAGAQQDWVRYDEHGLRRLCPRECAAMQSFPPNWKFVGPFGAQYRLIGNAVPPLLGAAVGASLAIHTSSRRTAEVARFDEVLPLSDSLAYHVRYTVRDDAANGQSRREAPNRRATRLLQTAV